jgi:hypothetical protein
MSLDGRVAVALAAGDYSMAEKSAIECRQIVAEVPHNLGREDRGQLHRFDGGVCG